MEGGGIRNPPPPPEVENVLNRPGEIGLMKKHTKWKWTTEHQDAFDKFRGSCIL